MESQAAEDKSRRRDDSVTGQPTVSCGWADNFPGIVVLVCRPGAPVLPHTYHLC